MKLVSKIILIQVILTVTMLLIFGAFSYVTSIGQLENSMRADGKILTEILSQTIAVHLWNVARGEVNNLLTIQLADAKITAVLLEENGKVSGKYKNTAGAILDYKDGEETAKFLENPFFIQEVAVKRRTELLGQLKVYFNADSIQVAKSRQFISLIVQILVLSLLIIGIFSFFGNRIGKNLKKVIDLLGEISAGYIKSLEKVDIKQNDEIGVLGNTFNNMLDKLKGISKDITQILMNLNSTSKEIQAAAQEQASGANIIASSVTEVSATMEELSITAEQITKNTSELVVASGEAVQSLEKGKTQLMGTVSQLEEVGSISENNTTRIRELEKRSELINDMVNIIKEVANSTNMLSINASIEASRAGEAGKGFSVVAAEIRELSKETISSAKKADKAANEIREFIKSIIISSEKESEKVVQSGKVTREFYDNIERIITLINNNYTFTQKIDISIKQQEGGSKEAAETMRQMAENSRQSAEIARQTSSAVKDIVLLGEKLQKVVRKFDVQSTEEHQETSGKS